MRADTLKPSGIRHQTCTCKQASDFRGNPQFRKDKQRAPKFKGKVTPESLRGEETAAKLVSRFGAHLAPVIV